MAPHMFTENAEYAIHDIYRKEVEIQNKIRRRVLVDLEEAGLSEDEVIAYAREFLGSDTPTKSLAFFRTWAKNKHERATALKEMNDVW
jgi:hypothetical protein